MPRPPWLRLTCDWKHFHVAINVRMSKRGKIEIINHKVSSLRKTENRRRETGKVVRAQVIASKNWGWTRKIIDCYHKFSEKNYGSSLSFTSRAPKFSAFIGFFTINSCFRLRFTSFYLSNSGSKANAMLNSSRIETVAFCYTRAHKEPFSDWK